MSITGFELLTLALPLVAILLGGVVLYLIIKVAVRNGIREALRDEGARGHLPPQ